MHDAEDRKELAAACRDGRFADAAKLAGSLDQAASGGLSADDAACAVQALVEAGRADRAAQVYLAALAGGLPLPEPRTVSNSLRQANHPDLDIACWEAWSKRFPDRPDGWLGHAWSLDHGGKQEVALALLQQASLHFPDDANVHADLGVMLLMRGKRDDALVAFSRAADLDPAQPVWVKRAVSALKRGVVELNGVILAVPPEAVSPTVLRTLAHGDYEGAELSLLRQNLKAEDRVLELGAGLGYLACFAARIRPGIAYTALEADPRLIPVLRENFRLNDCAARLIHGVAGARKGQAVFHAAADFWASSIETIAQPHRDLKVPFVDIRPLMAEFRPTLLVVDIEGAECALVPRLDLSGVEHAIIELHPDVCGHDNANRVVKALLKKGFTLNVQQSRGQVCLFERARGGERESSGGRAADNS